MSPVETITNAIEVLQSRRSVREYKADAPISDADLKEILELTTAAPSSWNLQHWRFVVIREQANKEKLLPLAYGQKQVVDAAVTILVLGDLQANLVADQVFAGAPAEVRETLLGQINGAYHNNPQLARDEAIRNASLASMQLMLAAKAKGYDTVPMGGFDKDAVVKLLNVPDRYIPVMLIALGVAAAPGRPSGRMSLDEIVINESF